MPRNSNLRAPARFWRIVLGALLAANVIAIVFVIYPPGGSALELEEQRISLFAQTNTRRAQLAQTRLHVAAVEKGRAEGDRFLGDYFLSRRTAYSTLLAELVADADEAKIKPKEYSYATEAIEGSDTLSLMTITANYEGTYANLMRFVHEMDRSPRMLIIEALTAAPEQANGNLSISLKLDAFVREDAGTAEVPSE